MLKQFGVEFVPVKSEDYRNIIDLYNKAEKEGWDKDYAAWLGATPAE